MVKLISHLHYRESYLDNVEIHWNSGVDQGRVNYPTHVSGTNERSDPMSSIVLLIWNRWPQASIPMSFIICMISSVLIPSGNSIHFICTHLFFGIPWFYLYILKWVLLCDKVSNPSPWWATFLSALGHWCPWEDVWQHETHTGHTGFDSLELLYCNRATNKTKDNNSR